MYRFRLYLLLLICICASFGATPGTRKSATPSLPNSLILFGYPPFKLYLSTSGSTEVLLETRTQQILEASLSDNGLLVASAFATGPESDSKFVIATYSVPQKKWTKRTAPLKIGNSISISHDGSKIAFATHDGDGTHIHILDLESNHEVVSNSLGIYGPGSLSWSPGGDNLLFEMSVNHPLENGTPWLKQVLFRLKIAEMRVSKFADGAFPSWSPSGEWVAYCGYDVAKEDMTPGSRSPACDQLWIAHPDGSGASSVAHLDAKLGFFSRAVVWSPNSRELLVPRLRDYEKDTFDYYLLDIVSREMSIKFRDVPPIFAWAGGRVPHPNVTHTSNR